MSIFNLFKKKPQKAHLSNIAVQAVSVMPEQKRQPLASPVFATESDKNFLKSSNGLYPHEILMLSYLEQYCAGKEPARFWKYQYNVENVPKLIKSLCDRGFAENGELTEKGKEELANNEYVLYCHRTKNLPFTMNEIAVLVNKNPKTKYRDLIWGELNRMSMLYITENKFGLYRNVQYFMCQFLKEEGKFADALLHLANAIHIDLNDNVPFFAKGLIGDIQNLEAKLDWDSDKMFAFLCDCLKKQSWLENRCPYNDVAKIITSIATGNMDLAENQISYYTNDSK